MKIKTIELDYEKGELKINGEKFENEIIVEIMDSQYGKWSRSKIFNFTGEVKPRNIPELIINYNKAPDKVVCEKDSLEPHEISDAEKKKIVRDVINNMP